MAIETLYADSGNAFLWLGKDESGREVWAGLNQAMQGRPFLPSEV